MLRTMLRRAPRRQSLPERHKWGMGLVVVALVGSGEPAFAAEAPPTPPPSAAAGGPVIDAVTVTPQQVVLTGPGSHNAPLRIRMRVRDPNGVDSAFAGLFGPKSESGRAFRLKRVSGTKLDGIWQVKGGLPVSAAPGAWRVQAFAVDTQQHSSDANDIYGSFAVRDAARFDQFTVSRSASGLELRAVLRRWDGLNWVAVPGAAVDVAFRSSGAGAYGSVGSVHTGPDGSVVAGAHDGVSDGTWRLSYAGDDVCAAVTSADAALPTPSPSPFVTATPVGEPATAAPRAVPSAQPVPATTGPTAAPTLRPPTASPAAPIARPALANPSPAPSATVRPAPPAQSRATPAPAPAWRPIGSPATRPTAHPATPVPGGPTPAAVPPREAGRGNAQRSGRGRVNPP